MQLGGRSSSTSSTEAAKAAAALHLLAQQIAQMGTSPQPQPSSCPTDSRLTLN